MRLLADKYIYKLESFLPEEVDLTTYDPIVGNPTDFSGFDALLVRTVTKINPTIINEFPNELKFLGTASSGSDHLDLDFIHAEGVETGDSKGCNANAVAEYVLTSLIYWSELKEVDLNSLSVGIIGYGFTGSLVAKKLDVLGIKHVDYDPPLAEWDSTFSSSSLEEVLDCDILTLHIPLIKDGESPTYHWLNYEKISHSPFKLIINASRGGIIEEKALIELFDSDHIIDCIKDVWENEPHYNHELVKRALVSTPHIAGYSEEAKLDATKMIVDKMAHHFGLNDRMPLLKSNFKDQTDVTGTTVGEVLLKVNPLLEYDAALKSINPDEMRRKAFARLRNNMTYRREYNQIILSKTILEKFPLLNKLGFLSHDQV